MPLTLYATSDHPGYPREIHHAGTRYVVREIMARNVRPGDLITLVDLAGPPGPGGFGYAPVTDTESVRSGYGRTYVAPWYRRILYAREWYGTLRSWVVPTTDQHPCAHTDRLTIYRAAGPSDQPNSYPRCAHYVPSGGAS